VKIGSEGTAVEVKKRGQDDCDQASPVTFLEEPGEITTTPLNHSPESTSHLEHYKQFVDPQELVDTSLFTPLSFINFSNSAETNCRPLSLTTC